MKADEAKLTHIKFSVPNDFASADAESSAIIECYEGDREAAAADEGRECYEAIAEIAKENGLVYIRSTDFGAIWAGTDSMIAAARKAMPAWVGAHLE